MYMELSEDEGYILMTKKATCTLAIPGFQLSAFDKPLANSAVF